MCGVAAEVQPYSMMVCRPAASFASLFTFVFSRGGVGHPIIFSHCQKQWETRRTDLSAAGGIADIEVATDLLASPPHH